MATKKKTVIEPRNRCRNCGKRHKYDAWFRKNFGKVRHEIANFYLTAIPWMEWRCGVKPGEWVLASIPSWAAASFMHKKTVRNMMNRLIDMGLIEFVPGEFRWGLKYLAKLRRRTIKEMEMVVMRRMGIDVMDKYRGDRDKRRRDRRLYYKIGCIKQDEDLANDEIMGALVRRLDRIIGEGSEDNGNDSECSSIDCKSGGGCDGESG